MTEEKRYAGPVVALGIIGFVLLLGAVVFAFWYFGRDK